MYNIYIYCIFLTSRPREAAGRVWAGLGAGQVTCSWGGGGGTGGLMGGVSGSRGVQPWPEPGAGRQSCNSSNVHCHR